MAPGSDTSEWHRLHPLSPVLRAGRVLLVMMVAVLQGSSEVGVVEALALYAVPVFLVVAVTYAVVSWRVVGYRLGDEELEIRSGVLLRSRRHVPIARIETVDIARPLFARLLGLADVRVEVVSQGRSEAHLRYLSEQRARDVRRQLVDARRASRPTANAAAVGELVSSGDEEGALAPWVAEEHTAPFVQVPTRDLILGHTVTPAIALGLIAAVIAVATTLASVEAGTVVGVVMFAIIPGSLVASAATIERLYAFRIADDGDALVIRRGLLNLLTQRINVGRIQAVRIEEPFLWRPFGRARLKVDVAGYRGSSGGDSGGTGVLLPIGTPATIAHLLAAIELHVDVGELSFEAVPSRARWRAPLRWQTYGLARTDDHVVMQYGLLRRMTDLVPRTKVQSARVTQGGWQRSLSLATVHVDTAGSGISARARHRHVAEAVAVASDAARDLQSPF